VSSGRGRWWWGCVWLTCWLVVMMESPSLLQSPAGLPVILVEHHLVYLLGLGDLYDHSQDGSSTVLGRLPCGIVVWGVCVVECVWGEEVGCQSRGHVMWRVVNVSKRWWSRHGRSGSIYELVVIVGTNLGKMEIYRSGFLG
jgi:hypothetical protein